MFDTSVQCFSVATSISEFFPLEACFNLFCRYFRRFQKHRIGDSVVSQLMWSVVELSSSFRKNATILLIFQIIMWTYLHIFFVSYSTSLVVISSNNHFSIFHLFITFHILTTLPQSIIPLLIRRKTFHILTELPFWREYRQICPTCFIACCLVIGAGWPKEPKYWKVHKQYNPLVGIKTKYGNFTTPSPPMSWDYHILMKLNSHHNISLRGVL